MSGGYVLEAARVTDDVAHSSPMAALALSVGALLGGALAVALTPITLGGSAALVLGIASGAKGVGEALDQRSLHALAARRELPKETGEEITTGAKSVFLDEPRERAAKAHPEVLLTHGGQWVTHGSKTVLIENTYASRLSDQASCGGFICNGSKTVFYGGTTAVFPGADADPSEVKDQGLYGAYSLALDVAALIAGGLEGAALLRAAARPKVPPRAAKPVHGDDLTDARAAADDQLHRGQSYRGDTRSPAELEGADGFRSVKPDGDSSLATHMRGDRPPGQWISASRDPQVAANYAAYPNANQNIAAAVDRWGDRDIIGYAYRIDQAGGVDVMNTPGLAGSLSAVTNKEVAFSQGVPWSSVSGWHPVYKPTTMDDLLPSFGDFVPNPGFVPK